MPPTRPVTEDPPLLSSCAWCGDPITVGVVTSGGLVLHLGCQRLSDTVTEWAEQDLHDDRPAPTRASASNSRSLDILTHGLGELLLDGELDDQDLREAAERLLPMLYDALREAGYGGPLAHAPGPPDHRLRDGQLRPVAALDRGAAPRRGDRPDPEGRLRDRR